MSATQLQGLRHHLAPARHRSAQQWAGDAAERALATLRAWRRRARDRARLTELDDRMLKDIGITRADVDYLRNKPFWRE
jgi:uncharacterized protein YjiS (DUF1127 family)